MQVPTLYTDDQGKTHFKDVEWDLKPASGPYPYDTTDDVPSTAISFRLMQPGTFADWHTTNAPHIAILLSGEMELEAGSGEKRRFKAGDVLIGGDPSGQGHISQWVGNEACLVAFVSIPLSVVTQKM